MIDIYSFEIDSDEFEKVLSGKKTIHLVINDAKRKVYGVGNKITFVRKENKDETSSQKADEEGSVKNQVDAEIDNLLYFADVKEAVETLGKETCGFRPSATFEKATDLFMSGESFENIERYGIVAISFKLI
jgi:ASC-1-like (ASCH) protein